MFTGVHAVHVLGGLIAIAVVYVRGRMGYYRARCHPGVRNAVIYWHYLGAV